MGRIRVALVVNGRENWGRLRPLAEELDDWKALEVLPICGGALGLPRFRETFEDIVYVCGCVHRQLNHVFDGRTHVTQAKGLGLAVIDYSEVFHNTPPDLVLMIGDRYETLGAAIAAATLRIPILHLQGGEVSGSLDERYRHCITKLADWHVPATQRAAERLVQMGESPGSILAVGCPTADLAHTIDRVLPPHIVVMQHPDTASLHTPMSAILDAIRGHDLPVKLFAPNLDAGSDAIRSQLHNWLQQTNLPPRQYLEVLANAACCVGNSSSFVRDAGFFGTPVVLVGDRQQGRECSEHVLRLPGDPTAEQIREAIDQQLEHGRYPPSDLYGKPGICREIADAICNKGLHQKCKGSWYDADSLAAAN